MSEASAIVEALYKNFLLRDLFAKIVPGTIVPSQRNLSESGTCPFDWHRDDI
jgi:hypothetical protein